MEETQSTVNSDVAPENQIKPTKPWLKIGLLVILVIAVVGAAEFWLMKSFSGPKIVPFFPPTAVPTISEPTTTPAANSYSTIYDLTKETSLSGKIRFIIWHWANYRETLHKVVTMDLNTLKYEDTYQGSTSESFVDLTDDGRFLSTIKHIESKPGQYLPPLFQLVDLSTGKVVYNTDIPVSAVGVSAALVDGKYLIVQRGMGSQVILDPNTGKVIASHPLVPFASGTWSFSPDLCCLAYEKVNYYYGGMPGVGPLTTSLGFIDLINNPSQNIEPFAATERWSDIDLCWKGKQLLFKRTFFKDLKKYVTEGTQILKFDLSDKRTEILCDQNCDEKEEYFKSTCDQNPLPEQEKKKVEQIDGIKRLIPPKLEGISSLSVSPDKKFALFEAGNPDNNYQIAVYIIDLLNQKTCLVGDGTSPRWVY